MNRPTFFCVIALAALGSGSSAFAKSIRIHGYVTSVKSPNEFEIDEYRITKDASVVLELEKSDDAEEKTTFNPEEIAVGTELDIRGELDEASNQLTARTIKVNLNEHQHLKRTALMEVPPQITKAGNAWEGQIHVDGQRVAINEGTLITIKPNNIQRKSAKAAEKASKKATGNRQQPEAEADETVAAGFALITPDQIKANTFVTYEGTRQKDGTVLGKL